MTFDKQSNDRQTNGRRIEVESYSCNNRFTDDAIFDNGVD